MAGKWAVIKENASDCVENCVAAASSRKITTVFQTYAFVSQRTNTPNAKKELCKIKLLELAHTVDENAKCTITHNECWKEPNEIDLNYLVVYICVHFAMCILSCTIVAVAVAGRSSQNARERTTQWEILIGLSMWTNGLPIQNISFI